MFSDDFWGIVTLLGVGVSAYCHGKNNGVNQTVSKYETQKLIHDQQVQIALLHQKIDEMKRIGV